VLRGTFYLVRVSMWRILPQKSTRATSSSHLRIGHALLRAFHLQAFEAALRVALLAHL
jgi:hypothetical protein